MFKLLKIRSLNVRPYLITVHDSRNGCDAVMHKVASGLGGDSC